MSDKKTKRKRRGGIDRLTPAFYQLLLDAFREKPGNIANAAKAADCARATARRGWNQGWEKHSWAQPIRKVIEEEQELARMEIERERRLKEAREELLANGSAPEHLDQRRQEILDEQRQRKLAKEQAVRSRAEEGQMVGGARKAVMQAEAGLLRIGEGIQVLAARCNKELAALAKEGNKDFKLAASLATIRKYAQAVRDVTQAANQAVELERLYLGEPTQIVGITAGNFEDAPIEEVMAEIEKAAKAIKDAKEQGVLDAEEPSKSRLH